jgi:HD-GYP domain-containing protein (c-di-GMP phosphodiesterase class II)
MGKALIGHREAVESPLDRLQIELDERIRQAEENERQLERYASDLRDTFKAERAQAEELRASYVATVRALTNAVEARDAYTGKHAERVAAYGLELTRRIDRRLAEEPQTEFGFLLHDVGKVAIPDSVLHKDHDLTDDERRLMRRHPEIGAQIVSGIDFLADAAKTVRHHHERFDGGGYPDGLRGEEIPLAARIFAVADALDAITTDRPYRPGVTLKRARREIQAGAGTQFDPAVVEALADVPDETLERIRTDIG